MRSIRQVPSPAYPTIQDAIDQSTDGDEIRVAVGKYFATVHCHGATAVICVNKAVGITGGWHPDFLTRYPPPASAADISQQTIINGRVGDAGNLLNWNRGVMVNVPYTTPQSAIILDRLRITNGTAVGSPPDFYASQNPENCSEDPLFMSRGGGLFIYNTHVVLNDSIIDHSQAIGVSGPTHCLPLNQGSGGGVYVHSSVGKARANPTSAYSLKIVNSTISNNLAIGGDNGRVGGSGNGGGLFSWNAYVSAVNLKLLNNIAQGGPTAGVGYASFIGSDGTQPIADGLGGGAMGYADAFLEFDGGLVQNNLALGGSAPNGNAGSAFGGGVYGEFSSLYAHDLLSIQGNYALGGDGRYLGTSTLKGTAGGQGNGGGAMINAGFFTAQGISVSGNLAMGGRNNMTSPYFSDLPVICGGAFAGGVYVLNYGSGHGGVDAAQAFVDFDGVTISDNMVAAGLVGPAATNAVSCATAISSHVATSPLIGNGGILLQNVSGSLKSRSGFTGVHDNQLLDSKTVSNNGDFDMALWNGPNIAYWNGQGGLSQSIIPPTSPLQWLTYDMVFAVSRDFNFGSTSMKYRTSCAVAHLCNWIVNATP